MPAVELMGWSKEQRRWFKKYRGRMYSVSPRQLKTEPTKEASRQSANEWWTRKQTEIDEKLGEAKRHPAQLLTHYNTAIENHRLYAKWQRKYGDPSEAERSETMMEWLRDALKTDAPPFPLTKLQEDPRWFVARDLELGDDQNTFYLLWFERFRTIRQEEQNEQMVPIENTIRAHIDAYFDLCKAQALASYHQRILERLRLDEDVVIYQYKSLYFSIFQEAYESGFCHPLFYYLHTTEGGFNRSWIFTNCTLHLDQNHAIWLNAVFARFDDPYAARQLLAAIVSAESGTSTSSMAGPRRRRWMIFWFG